MDSDHLGPPGTSITFLSGESLVKDTRTVRTTVTYIIIIEELGNVVEVRLNNVGNVNSFDYGLYNTLHENLPPPCRPCLQ